MTSSQIIQIRYVIFIKFLLITILLFSSCSEESFDCDECDEPHQSFYVNIVDTLGRPVNSLNIIVSDACGNELYVPQSPIAAAIGQYTLINGEYVDLRTMAHICNNQYDNVEIKFLATDGTKSVEKNFTFRLSGGLCQCEYGHVSLTPFSNQPPVLVFK